jgi:transglutaminase-like putative cysteine protease
MAIVIAAVACDGPAPSTHEPRALEPSWVATFVAPRTTEDGTRDLFEVESARPEYWRLLTLDRYDGGSWTSTNLGGSAGGVLVRSPAIFPRPAGSPEAEARTLNQTFRILGDFDSAHALPMAQTAEEITGPVGEITWDPAASEAFIDGDLEAGAEYTVRSRIVVPTPGQLDLVGQVAPSADGPWTELPADLDPRIGKIARHWTSEATSDYRRVLAIQQHFQDGSFAYDTSVDTSVGGDAMIEFLTRRKSGFCVHYSSAMAVMVRMLGLPARIGVGYRPGTHQPDGSYLVRTGDEHVWVEVFFSGYGWLQFEPEPGTVHPNAAIGTYLSPRRSGGAGIARPVHGGRL